MSGETKAPAKAGETLYAQVRDRLAEGIAQCRWPAGSLLPGEHELCALFSVSRITVRQALKGLEEEGLVERSRGRGTTVRARPFEQRLAGMYSFSEELQRSGARPSSRVLGFERRAAAEAAAAALGLEPGAEVLVVERLRLMGDEPFALEFSSLPPMAFAGLDRPAVESAGLYAAMQAASGLAPGRAEETFAAVPLPGEYAQHLDLKRGAPVLLVERVAFHGGQPVEHCLSYIRTDRLRFKILLK